MKELLCVTTTIICRCCISAGKHACSKAFIRPSHRCPPRFSMMSEACLADCNTTCRKARQYDRIINYTATRAWHPRSNTTLGHLRHVAPAYHPCCNMNVMSSTTRALALLCWMNHGDKSDVLVVAVASTHTIYGGMPHAQCPVRTATFFAAAAHETMQMGARQWLPRTALNCSRS